MLEKLFESLDDKVFTTELKESLELQFNEAVDAKATTIAEERIEEEIDVLSEKSEEHIDMLTEKAEEFVELQREEMTEALDKYLDRIVEEFVADAKESLDESVKSEKADMLIEAFDAMLIAGGVEVASIVEAKDEKSVSNELETSIGKYDALIEETIELKEENEVLIKMGVISELKEGLSIVESEKFEKLAELVEFQRDSVYLEKLTTIKESVQSVGSETKTKTLSESVTGAPKAPVWAHLV